MRCGRNIALLSAVVAGLAACTASAATINFEAPTYAPGNLIGQDGWTLNSYANTAGSSTANPNGSTLTVSTDSPLSGSQSVFYDQTTYGAVNDVSRAAIATVAADGTPAADFTASAIMRVDANAALPGQLGVFFGDNTVNGFEPINLLLNQVSSATLSGNYEVAYNGAYQIVGSYTPDDTVKATFSVDLDSSTYSISVDDLTAGTTTPLGTFPFLQAIAAAPTVNLGVGLLLRAGTGEVDDITVTPLTAVPEPTTLGTTMAALGAMALIRRRRSV